MGVLGTQLWPSLTLGGESLYPLSHVVSRRIPKLKSIVFFFFVFLKDIRPQGSDKGKAAPALAFASRINHWAQGISYFSLPQPQPSALTPVF